MEESSSRTKINFIKLNQEELSAKIALLVSQKTRVIFWKNTPRYYEGSAFSFSIYQKKICLTLDECNIHLQFKGLRICVNFMINGIDYFLRGKVSEQSEEHFQVVIELEENCFRVEKRKGERLLAYPIYEIYAYLKYKKDPISNVVFLNKKEQEHQSFFSEIDNLQKNKLRNLDEKLTVDDSQDLVGFRVENLSASGLSFLASVQEKENILDPIGSAKVTLVLNFELQVFTLEEVNIIYKIDYINSQFSGIPMYKIGVTFKTNLDLKNKIEEHAGIQLSLEDYQKEFEEFIKNE